MLEPIAFPIHGGYEFQPASVPVMALEETLADKLGAYWRHVLVRDLYECSGSVVTNLIWGRVYWFCASQVKVPVVLRPWARWLS